MNHLDIAISQIDKQEIPKGSNWGPDVKMYLNSVGINFPASWCMAFVYWCCKQANASTPLVRTGGVLAQWNKVPKQFKTQEPSVGDIFIMDFGKGLGHTGFIERIEGDILHTIEGNTNDSGSREGYEVCRRTRKKSQMKGYIKIPRL